jgi:tripartite-type tricarboxylate transporter receptor subunit TctC
VPPAGEQPLLKTILARGHLLHFAEGRSSTWAKAMTLRRRNFLHLAAAGAAAFPIATRIASAVAGGAVLPAIPYLAWAQTYPTRPVRLVVGFPPGGAADLISRLIGQWLSDRLGQSVFIENRAGAGSNIATEFVVHAPPDGYTLLDLTSTNSFNVTLYDNLKFDLIRDIVPVASIYRGPAVLVVHPSFPAKTLPEFITYLKANPGKVNMASGGVGTPQHLYGELFKKMAGVDMLHVAYRGGGPALTDLLAGRVPVMFDTFSTSIEHIRAGELRALAVTSATRSNVLPDIPAIAEVVSGYVATGWQGIGAPAKTPATIVDKLNKEVNAALADPKFTARLVDLGYEPFPSSPAEFAKFVVEYTDKWSKVIRAANITVE